jgi:hypothetical protein
MVLAILASRGVWGVGWSHIESLEKRRLLSLFLFFCVARYCA